MIGLYFSGTGNSKYCVEKFVEYFDTTNLAISIENIELHNLISEHDLIILGYPVYFSNIPKILRDFILNNHLLFQNKKIFIISTMGLFSGDGAGCSARLLKKQGGEIIGGLHVKMPDCIGDEKLLKKSLERNKEIVTQAVAKIINSAKKLENNNPTQEGLGVGSLLAGLFGQRLWFYNKATTYKEKPNVDKAKCIGCGTCKEVCPMGNIHIAENKAVSGNKCTLCYRCFSQCPTRALTILGNKVYEQPRLEKYI